MTNNWYRQCFTLLIRYQCMLLAPSQPYGGSTPEISPPGAEPISTSRYCVREPSENAAPWQIRLGDTSRVCDAVSLIGRKLANKTSKQVRAHSTILSAYRRRWPQALRINCILFAYSAIFFRVKVYGILCYCAVFYFWYIPCTLWYILWNTNFITSRLKGIKQ